MLSHICDLDCTGALEPNFCKNKKNLYLREWQKKTVWSWKQATNHMSQACVCIFYRQKLTPERFISRRFNGLFILMMIGDILIDIYTNGIFAFCKWLVIAWMEGVRKSCSKNGICYIVHFFRFVLNINLLS